MTALFQRVFTRLIVLYGLAVSLIFIGRLFLRDSISVVGLLASGAHLLLITGLIMFPFAVWLCRPRRAALALIPLIIIFLGLYGGQFIPSRSSKQVTDNTLTVMTYNILWRSDTNYQDAIEVILEADADIVGLQEVNPEAERALRNALGSHYPYSVIESEHHLNTGGVALFSRYPIITSERIDGLFNNQRVVIDVDGTPLVAYNMHAAIPQGWGSNVFNFNAGLRDIEVNALADKVQAETSPVVILGDFNMTDLSDDYQTLAGFLTDAYREVGWGMGWTHSGPFVRFPIFLGLEIIRIDYIFTSRETVRVLDAQVWHDSGGSDHLPVVATLELRPIG